MKNEIEQMIYELENKYKNWYKSIKNENEIHFEIEQTKSNWKNKIQKWKLR